MPESHPIILCAGETEKRDFPLILIFGREPNDDCALCNGVGDYPLSKFPHGFWGCSYDMVARILGLTSRALKEGCAKASPIIYANAFPRGLKNSVGNKNKLRARFTTQEIINHIEATFANKLVARVKMVITSRLDGCVFERPKQKIAAECPSRELPLFHLPFFHGRNSKRIQQSLADGAREKIKFIFAAFNASTQRPGEADPENSKPTKN